jgi:hypothetical protein
MNSSMLKKIVDDRQKMVFYKYAAAPIDPGQSVRKGGEKG